MGVRRHTRIDGALPRIDRRLYGRAMAADPTVLTTPERLLAATERLVVREGVHALSVRRIATEAGVNSALVRYHFGDTDGLLRELALRNGACIADARTALLDGAREGADFDALVDALVLPLFVGAAMDPQFRAIVVLDEIFSRAEPALHDEIWALFADGVACVTASLGDCMSGADRTELAWRIRFVTAAALDIPPRSTTGRTSPERERSAARGAYGTNEAAERLDRFRNFARAALQLP
jgi:AcrR family transcriptional regulator